MDSENNINPPNEEHENLISNENDISEDQATEELQEVSNLVEQNTEEDDNKENEVTSSSSMEEQNEELNQNLKSSSESSDRETGTTVLVPDTNEDPRTEPDLEELKTEISDMNENIITETDIEEELKSEIHDINENIIAETDIEEELKSEIPDINENIIAETDIEEELKSEIHDINNKDEVLENQSIEEDINKHDSESYIESVEIKSEMTDTEDSYNVLQNQSLDNTIKQESENLSASPQSLTSDHTTNDDPIQEISYPNMEISELIQLIRRLIQYQNDGLIGKDANIEDIIKKIDRPKTNIPLQYDTNYEYNANTFEFYNRNLKEEPPLPYTVHEFKSKSYVLKFDINDSGTIFKVSLPTLKEKEIVKYKSKNFIKNQPHIKEAIKIAIKRNKDYAYNCLNKICTPGQTLQSTLNHVLRIERSRRMKLRLKANISAVKDLPISPEKYIPNVSRRKRPTEYPPASFRSPVCRAGESVNAARMRAARLQYIQRSDDAWLYHLRNRNVKPKVNQVKENLTISPQVYDPWSKDISKTINLSPIKIRSSLNPDSKIISRNYRARQLHLTKPQRPFLI